MVSRKEENIWLACEAIIIYSISYFITYKNVTFNWTEYTIVSFAILTAIYSTTAFFLRFSFYGQYSEETDSEKNALLRFGTMMISISITILVLFLN